MKPEIFRFIRHSVVLCLLLFASFSYAGTWVENFDDGNYDGWKLVIGSLPQRATVNVVNGELVFRDFNIPSSGTEDWLVLEASRDWSDYIIELRFKFTEEIDPDFTSRGMIVTYHDTFDGVPEGGPNTLFAAALTGGEVMGWVAIDGKFIGIKSGVFQFSPGTWYHMKILVEGTHSEIFIDGQQVVAYDVEGFTKGGVGIGAPNVVTHFDDIRISGASVPDGGATAVRARGKLATLWAVLKK